ncbi:MAG: hypothetical protein Q9218_002526 [Villophora microphyllina]
MALPPPTPPSTAPTSPRSPTSSDGDCIINVGNDPEKDGLPYYTSLGSAQSPSVAAGDAPSQSLSSRVKNYLPTLTGRLPHVPRPFRKEDGREKIISSIDDHPRGYPKTRVLLHRQDELAEMEKKLLAMDDEDFNIEPLALQSRRLDRDRPEEPSRTSLIEKIDDKLKDYDDLVKRIRNSVAIPNPLERDYSSLYNYVEGNKPLCREETKFIKYHDDFIALAEKQEGGWFDGVLEDMLGIFPRSVTRRILSSPEERKKTDDEYVQLYSKYRVDILARLILTIVSVVLLAAPTAILFLVPEHGWFKILLIMIFTLLFSAALSVFTKAKRHEMFAATAA